MTRINFPRPLPFIQNERRCWVTTINAKDATEISVPEQGEQMSLGLFDHTNRAVEPPHVNSISKYLEKPNWALPALILAVLPGTIPETGTKTQLPLESKSIRILDGQHRIQALRQRVLGGDQEIGRQEIAVIIMEVADGEDQKEIWLDFSKNKQIEGAWRDAIDNKNPFNRAGKMAEGISGTLRNRVKVEHRNIDETKDIQLITLSWLKRVSTTIAIGLQRNPGTRIQAVYQPAEKQEELRDRIVRFFDEFLPQCLPNYAEINEKPQFGRTLREIRSETHAYDAQVINLLADVHARWVEEGRDEGDLAVFVGAMNFNKRASENWLSQHGVHDFAKYAAPKEKATWGNASIKIAKEAKGEEE